MTKEQVLLALEVLAIEHTKDDSTGNVVSERPIQLSISGKYFPPNMGEMTFYFADNLVVYRDTFISVAYALDTALV